MMPAMSSAPDPQRLLAIIELQNAIAAAAMNAEEVMHIVADRARILLAAAGARVALVDGDELAYRAVVGPGPAEGSRVARDASPAGACIAQGRAVKLDSGDACVPLLYGETAVGALEVTGAAPGDDDLETLRLLGQIIAIALHRAYTYPRPRVDSLQDALTGLGNRRAFDERLEAELNRNRRFKHSFSLALVELDGLETAIDRLGQAAGDDMIRRIATILKQHTRMIDGCFRIHADGLAIVMPGTSLEGAQIVTERCRAHAAESRACDPAVRLGFGVVFAIPEEAAPDILGRAAAELARDQA
jgi:diguanylate cyclase (GGDEF)-like protein